jgi:hypothetical protein
VRVQRIVLENHGDIPVLGGDVVDEIVPDVQLAAGDFLQPRDHAQYGGFSAAGRADQHKEFLILNIQAQVVYGGYVAG